jgi:serine/threonine protein kinase
MNEEIARRKALTLISRQIAGWEIGQFLGSGKTAFVCIAQQGNINAAIKLFDNSELSDSEESELKSRLDRQLLLRGKNNPNLVDIYDSGYDNSTGFYFLVMQYVEGVSLAKCIGNLPRNKIGTLISQIATAAQYLETLELVHRDIKPENIIISPDFSKAVLLDLGVLRPLGRNEITDSTNTHRFIGTLRYSSPEYLFRKEEDNTSGWRAVTFYQLGAVLHDMIMQVPLFHQQTEPFATLVHAIEFETPSLYRDNVDPSLIQLARFCLLKSPTLRLKMLTWNNFFVPKAAVNKIDEIKKRLQQRKETGLHKLDILLEPEKGDVERNRSRLTYDIKDFIDKSIRNICIDSELFPRITINHFNSEKEFDHFTITIFSSSEKHLLPHDLSIIVTASILDLDSQLIELQCVGLLRDTIQLEVAGKFLSVFYQGFIGDTQLHESIGTMLHVMLDAGQLRLDAWSTSQPLKEPNLWIIYKLQEVSEKNE